jgi:hypothetical protein
VRGKVLFISISTSFPLPGTPLISFNNNKENNMKIKSKEVIDRDTIWQVFYDEDNDELYRLRVEKVKERWNKEEEYALDKYNDNMESYR